MHIYTLEFFIEKLDMGSNKLQQPDMDVLVTCGDLLNFRVQYNIKLSAALMKSTGGGKAVFFSASSSSRLVSAFSTEVKVVIVEVTKGNEEYVGQGDIKWKGNFEKAAEALNNQYDHIECDGKYPLFKDGKEVGSIAIQMCLVYYGDRIEIPIAYMGSELAIPITFRRKEFTKHKKTSGVVSDEQTPSAWANLFMAPKKQAKSIMDPTLEIYAEMSGLPVPPRLASLLTPDYINNKLCGQKACPGAQKFKEYGLGPLASQGSCLGTVGSIKEVKPYGLYGMSQAYGTMDQYGAYGLFVKKSDKKRKVCCGSPDCPYSAFYGMPDDLPEGEDMPPTPTINEVTGKPKICQCKNCKKYGSKGSKSSSKSSGCGSPNCPKKTPKSGVPCPYRNNRQSAGADRYGQQYDTIHEIARPCSGAICPARPGECLGSSCNKEGCEEDANKCGGRQCPYNVGRSPGECPEGTCPHVGCGKGSRRKSKSSEPPPGMLDELNYFLDKTRKNCCKNKSCPYYEAEGEDETRENCKDKTCPYYKEEPEDEYGLCGGQVCPLIEPQMETSTKNKKRLSLLVNEDGQKILLGKGDDQQEILGNIRASNQSDIYLLISRLVADRQKTQSLNNYFNPDLPLSMQNLLSSTRFRSIDSGRTGDILDFPPEKKKRKGPCSADSCRFLKYKTCSECGGVSKSGATCDNTEVSFSTISYDSIVTGAGDQTLSTKTENTEPPTKDEKKIVPAKKKIGNKDETAVKIAKVKKRKTRFVYTGGETYPGVRRGHKTCVYPSKNVPAHMGWLWNIKKEGERKRKKPWRPGYLRAEIEAAIIANRRKKGIPDPPELKMLVRRQKFKTAQYESDSEEEEVVPKPTLKIEKKDGNYLITMHPLKDPKTLVDREDPYMRCKPIQFVITKPPKNKKVPNASPLYDEMEGECEDEELDNYYKNHSCFCDGEDLESSSSSDSELNIEFTTPAGIINPEMFKKPPNVCNVETQFQDADFQCNDCETVIPKKFKRDRRSGKKK